MAINKVEYYGNTLIDLTDTTATADKILTGYGAYGANGEWMDGTATSGSGELAYVNFNAQLSSSRDSTYSNVLDVGQSGNLMRYGGSLFNRGSTYTGILALQGSQNNSSWSTINSVTRNSGGQTSFNGTDSSYRYYRLRLYNASSNNIACGMMMVCIKSGSAGTNAISPEEEVM